MFHGDALETIASRSSGNMPLCEATHVGVQQRNVRSGQASLFQCTATVSRTVKGEPCSGK